MLAQELSMTRQMLFAFISVAIVSAIPLFAFSFMRVEERKLKSLTGLLVALAIGSMLGDVVFHIYPEAAEEHPTTFWLFGLAGIAIFFIAEHLIHWHHHAVHDHVHPTGKLILLGDGLHNFVDGLLIAGSFLIDIRTGIATTIAVVLHEIPQEIGDFSVLLRAGYSKPRAIKSNFISACSAILGVAVGAAGNTYAQNLPIILLSVTAGGFLYISIADLLPWVLKKKDSLLSTFTIFILGMAAMYLLTFVG